jgi:hypothetical protein
MGVRVIVLKSRNTPHNEHRVVWATRPRTVNHLWFGGVLQLGITIQRFALQCCVRL